METPILNTHNKAEYEPAHSAEHILNQTMVRMFGCPRSRNAHVEKKKSKCDYILDSEPTPEQVTEIESMVNAGYSVDADQRDAENQRPQNILPTSQSAGRENAEETAQDGKTSTCHMGHHIHTFFAFTVTGEKSVL